MKKSIYKTFVKRLMDIIFGLIGTIVLIPIHLLLCIILYLFQGAPVFFCQNRYGKDGKLFKIYKYRSMKVNAEELINEFSKEELERYRENYKLENDSRETKIGHIIRKTSLDELPQFFNILKGEMSLIGPRPIVKEEINKYTEDEIKNFFSIKPGLTGYWQAYADSSTSYEERKKMELYYVANESFVFDLKIFFKSIGTVIKKMFYISKSDDKIHRREDLNNTSYYNTLDTDNKTTKEVSIIMPVYNSEEFIENTINSVKKQIYDDWELIIIDDGSTDNSLELIYKTTKTIKEKVKIITLHKNIGVASARNVGINMAYGKYIAFIDSDDVWHEEKLNKQIEFMTKNNYFFSYTAFNYMKGNTIKPVKKIPLELKYNQALKNTIILTSTVMIDITKINKSLIKMPNICSEDTATWWRILREGFTAFGLRETLTDYRIRENSLSYNKKNAIKKIWNLYRNVEKINLIKSIYYFLFYAFNAVKKRT